MAFVYLSGGQVLRVMPSREAIANDLPAALPDGTLEYEVDFPGRRRDPAGNGHGVSPQHRGRL